MSREELNTIIAATGLAVAVLQLLITLMGAVAAVITVAFMGGIAVGVLTTHYRSRGRGS